MLVHVDVQEARQRVLAGDGVVGARLDEGLAILGERNGAYAGGDVADTGVADAVQGGGDGLYHGGGARLLVHAALEVTVAQGVFLEVTVGTGHGVATEQLQILAGPAAVQTQIRPLGGRLGFAALEGAGEDGVDLRHGQPLDGVVLVDEHGQGIDGDADGGRLVAVALLECLLFTGLHGAAHGAKLGDALGQGSRCGGRTGGLDLHVDVGIHALKFFGPQGHHVGQGVRADRGQVARDAAGRCVFRQVFIHTGSQSADRKQGCCGESDDTSQFVEFHPISPSPRLQKAIVRLTSKRG